MRARFLCAPQVGDDPADVVPLDQAAEIARAAQHRQRAERRAGLGRVVDVADHAVGGIVAGLQLAGDFARRLAGADDQHLVDQQRGAADLREQGAPGRDGHQQDGQRLHERQALHRDRRHRQVEDAEDDRGGAGRLDKANEQFAPGLDERQIVDVVVVQAQLAQRRRRDDLPRPRAGPPVQMDRDHHRGADHHHLHREEDQLVGRDVALEQLHGPDVPGSAAGSISGCWRGCR